MTYIVFYSCPNCHTPFVRQYGVTPVCYSRECVQQRYKEIITSVGEKKEILARQLQYHSEMRLSCGCVLCGCSNCNILFLNEKNNKPICPICGDYCPD